MIEIVLIYLLLGAFAGVVAGLLGVGGGLIIVPVLAYLFQRQGIDDSIIMHLALGTSLATIVMTSISSVRAHHRRGAVLWHLVKTLAPALMLGAAAGAVIAHHLSSDALQGFFSVFEMGVGLYMLLGRAGAPAEHALALKAGEMRGVGAGIGAVSSLLGIGGGTMTVPYLSWRGVPMPNAVAVSAACGLPIAVGGALGYVVSGWGVPVLPAWSSGYLYWPALVGICAASLLTAPQGARLAHYLPRAVLKRVFAVFLILMGVGMWLGH